MIKNIRNQFLLLILPFCFLFIAPFTHGAQGSFDDEKSHTISDPLVMLVGISEYDHMDNLPGVDIDMKILHDLFVKECDYETRSTYHHKNGTIQKRLTDDELDKWLKKQYDYLYGNLTQKNTRKHDGLIFFFLGHGEGDSDGNDKVITSDGEKISFAYIKGIFSSNANNSYLKRFANKPKLFFKLACRGKEEEKIPDIIKVRGNSKFAPSCAEIFSFFPTQSGYHTPDITNFGEVFSRTFKVALGNKQKHLFDIALDVNNGLSVIECGNFNYGITKKVFFSPRRKIMDQNTKKEWWKALEKGETNKIKEILQKYNVDLNAQNEEGNTPLHFAAAWNRVATAMLFLTNGAKKNAQNEERNTPLHYAATNNSVEVAKYLIGAGANVKAQDKYGLTPLHHAAAWCSVGVAELLLKEGADKVAQDEKGETPLHSAAWKNHIKVAKVLIKAGANKDAKDKEGYTPLHYAAISNRAEVTELLLKEGANKDVKNEKGETPLHSAAWNNHIEVAKVLIKAGANKDSKDKEGYTPLHYAVFKIPCVDLARLLIEAGADKNAKTSWFFGYTPLDFAKKKKNKKMIDYLKGV